MFETDRHIAAQDMTILFRANNGELITTGLLLVSRSGNYSTVHAGLLRADDKRSLQSSVKAISYAGSMSLAFDTHTPITEEEALALHVHADKLRTEVSYVDKPERRLLEAPRALAHEAFYDMVPHMAPEPLRPHAGALLGIANVLAFYAR